MVYTVGTALQRAAESGRGVEVLVEGSWIAGSVAAVDGHGVVLDLGGVEHTVVRIERVSAVRVLEVSPHAQEARTARPLPVDIGRLGA
jgi:ribosomal protein S1